MGILDDAIREHLELKRQHGAESDDLERLENEAFGPATRPGDPDFEAPDTGAEATVPAPEEAPPKAPSTGGTSDWLADGGEETTVAPQVEEPAPSAEAARAEHPQLGDTADHPAPDQLPAPTAEEAPEVAEPPPLAEPLPPEPGAGEPASEEAAAEPPEAPESSIFDGDDLEFGDLEIEDDDAADSRPGAEEASPFIADDEDLSLAFEDEVPPTGESSLPPREEVLRDGVVEEDTGNPPLPVPPEEEPEGALAEPLPPAEDESESEDLLEETPDFLRDTPEGDQAWFEQDPPKDFDFDD